MLQAREYCKRFLCHIDKENRWIVFVVQFLDLSFCLSVSLVKNLEQALVCALSYLLFHEGAEFMTENVEHYTEMLGHGAQPRRVGLQSNSSFY